MRKLLPSSKYLLNVKALILLIGLFLIAVSAADLAMAATFKTVNGEVLIEAEQYTRLGGSIGGKWFVNSGLSGFKGSGYLESTKNDPGTLRYSNDIMKAEYDIDFKTAGTYYLYLRTLAKIHTENGFFATINGKQFNYGSSAAYFVYVEKTGTWLWWTDGGGAEQRGLKVSFNVSTPGKKTLAIYRRDKGSRIDQIWLTKNVSYPQRTAEINRPDPSTFIVSGGATPAPEKEICNDGKDNDGNGRIDCMDPACDNDSNCNRPSTETSCSNNADDDGDGWTDCADTDCHGASNCTPSKEVNCSDGFDNDGDGSTDCGDNDCSVAAACSATLYSQSFDSGQGPFFYEDDVFRDTKKPLYAKGNFSANGGYSGGGLYVAIGGIDGADILDGMSGGWSDDFRVQNSGTVNFSIRYRLITNRYDADECGQIMVAVDDKPVVVNGNDYVQQLCGRNDSGWQKISFNVNLSVGLHKLTIGGFNNKKTAPLELTEIFIDDIIIGESDDGSTGGGTEPPAADGFTYSDNTFRGTKNSMYASGSTEGGALMVSLGGIDGVDVTNGISGGWKSSFKTSTSGTVQINLMYRLITNRYDADECGQALVSVDGKLNGLNGKDYLEQSCGIGDSGWQQVTLNVNLAAGNHTLILGGYNNKKTAPKEVTEVLFDNIDIIQ